MGCIQFCRNSIRKARVAGSDQKIVPTGTVYIYIYCSKQRFSNHLTNRGSHQKFCGRVIKLFAPPLVVLKPYFLFNIKQNRRSP